MGQVEAKQRFQKERKNQCSKQARQNTPRSCRFMIVLILAVDGVQRLWGTWREAPIRCLPAPVQEKRRRSCLENGLWGGVHACPSKFGLSSPALPICLGHLSPEECVKDGTHDISWPQPEQTYLISPCGSLLPLYTIWGSCFPKVPEQNNMDHQFCG